jgi:hypothetical protein
VYADHGISNPTPTTQINVFQSMSEDDLRRKVDGIKQISQDAIDTDLVDLPDSTLP